MIDQKNTLLAIVLSVAIIIAFQYLDHYRARSHKINQIVEERTLFVDRIETFSFTTR